jgi:predicted HTH transcriptional regulator
MLVRVLNVAADSLEEAVFDDLVTNAVVEHQRLEYKSQLPGTSPDDRRELARDGAAMANGGGGIIVMGIEDDANDAATRITPVGLGSEVTRLSQICNSLIEPYLRIDMHEVEIGGGPDGIIVVEATETKPNLSGWARVKQGPITSAKLERLEYGGMWLLWNWAVGSAGQTRASASS